VTLLYRPDGVGRTIEYLDMLVHPETLEKGRDRVDEVFEFWAMVNRQDIEIVERVQRGLSTAPYPGGRMCYEFEEPIHRFQNMVIDRMLGLDRIPPGDDESGTTHGRTVAMA
jgi:choline monooxygenase